MHIVWPTHSNLHWKHLYRRKKQNKLMENRFLLLSNNVSLRYFKAEYFSSLNLVIILLILSKICCFLKCSQLAAQRPAQLQWPSLRRCVQIQVCMCGASDLVVASLFVTLIVKQGVNEGRLGCTSSFTLPKANRIWKSLRNIIIITLVHIFFFGRDTVMLATELLGKTYR